MEGNYINDWLQSFIIAIKTLPVVNIERYVEHLRWVKEHKGRVFVLGVGGGASEASHVVQDLRKICGIEAYSATENVGEITARTNDDGWSTTLIEFLKVSGLNKNDGILVLSCSGGLNNISPNISRALDYATTCGVGPMAIVGDPDGSAAYHSPFPIIVNWKHREYRTPFTEAMWSVVMHLVVNHPELKEA